MTRLKTIQIIGPDGRILDRIDSALIGQTLTVVWTFDGDVAVSGFSNSNSFGSWLDHRQMIEQPTAHQLAFTGVLNDAGIEFPSFFSSVTGGVYDLDGHAVQSNWVLITGSYGKPVSMTMGEAPELDAPQTISVAETDTDIAQLDVWDEDPETLSFAITGGDDAHLFEIDDNGVLRFVSARDYEAPTDLGREGIYSVEVTVTDEVGKTDSQTIDVTVTDVNEAPGLALASYGIAENTTHVARIAASDPEGDELIFSIAGGADGALFEIDADGTLAFIAAPDFEAPADADGDNVYDVTVAVSDGVLGDSFTYQVHVDDVADAFLFV